MRHPNDSWTDARVGRLGYLMGLGWDVKRIADDPIVSTTPNNVHRRAHVLGLAFRRVAVDSPWALPSDVNETFDKAASKRGLTRPALIRLLLLELATDKHLIDNVLDDGCEEAA